MTLRLHLSQCHAALFELGNIYGTLPAVDHSGEEEVHHYEDSQCGLPADSLPKELIVMSGHIAKALQGRLSSMKTKQCLVILTSSLAISI